MISVTTISNISNQVVKLLYSKTAASNSATTVDYNTDGELAIQPGSSVKIESLRIDQGQLQKLASSKLISYVTS